MVSKPTLIEIGTISVQCDERYRCLLEVDSGNWSMSLPNLEMALRKYDSVPNFANHCVVCITRPHSVSSSSRIPFKMFRLCSSCVTKSWCTTPIFQNFVKQALVKANFKNYLQYAFVSIFLLYEVFCLLSVTFLFGRQSVKLFWGNFDN